MDTLGPIWEDTHELIEEIGHKITDITSGPWETQFMFQRLSVAVQSFGAVCMSQTFQIC